MKCFWVILSFLLVARKFDLFLIIFLSSFTKRSVLAATITLVYALIPVKEIEARKVGSKLVGLCEQKALCLYRHIWNQDLCQCVHTKECSELKKCERGWKFDKTTCECFKVKPSIQRYLCRQGTVYCEHCAKCNKIKDCSIKKPVCIKRKEIFDESVCKCLRVGKTCIQKYECIDGYEFDFDKCICVAKENE